MRTESIRLRRLLPALAGLLLLVACGGDSPTDPTPDPITITITGVDDGGAYDSAVTIGITTSRGTYEARLDGALFLSGQTVSDVGTHTLTVIARDGAETATAQVGFEITFAADSFLIVRMLDLGDNAAGGGGDAILVTDSAQGVQASALIDAGPAGADGADPGYVARRLQALGVSSLEAVIMTHAHSDHFAGLPAVLNAIPVERFIYNGQQRTYSAYTTLISQARTRADTVIVPTDTVVVALSGGNGTIMTVIPPITKYLDDPNASSSEMNNGSVGAALTRGGFSMFLTGDGEVEANNRWRTQYGTLTGSLDVLKAGHHAANDAIFDNGYDGSSAWLAHTDPAVVLVSANGTTHPRLHAITALLARSNTRTYCTNVHGEITVRVKPDGEYLVTPEKNATLDCVAGSDATS